MTRPFGNVYKGKRVFITGHTGFKGSWLTLWLLGLGASVTGYSLDIPTKPSNFEALGLRKKIKHVKGDVRDLNSLKKAIDDSSPDIVFHLAAQALARRSYDMPQDTFFTNLGGTVNMLECLRSSGSVEAAVIITSDKCYQNVEKAEGYKESDLLGGNDPYSASKACAEIAAKAYMRSFFSGKNSLKIATARAGNVIGGGDWAEDRIIPDCVRALSKGKSVMIRNPEATRPWQHVLEPLSGYLYLGQYLLERPKMAHGEAFNFGPNEMVAKSVREVMELFLSYWGEGSWKYVPVKDGKKESKLLKLSCAKARSRLGWSSALNFKESIRFTADWYKNYYGKVSAAEELSYNQIDEYVNKAYERNVPWVTGRKR
ncbi:MAG: CDP-glucose 4,6-dehydratase [Candidatus Omnitrophota bacterium]|jgi:CDP-glucose 4,6-dehydratase